MLDRTWESRERGGEERSRLLSNAGGVWEALSFNKSFQGILSSEMLGSSQLKANEIFGERKRMDGLTQFARRDHKLSCKL